MEPIIIQAEPTAKEVNQAIFEHRCQTLLMAPMVLIFVLTVLTETYTIYELRESDIFDFIPANVRFSFFLISPLALAFLYFFYEKNKDFTGGITPRSIKYLFTKKGVQIIDAQGTSFTKWKDITNGYDCLDSLAFVINQAVFVIPKRNFKDGEQLKNTRNLMKERLARFSYALGKRKTVSFENTYEKNISINGADALVENHERKSLLPIDVPLPGPEAAKVLLRCRYMGAEISEFLWRYVTRARCIFRSVSFFCIYSLIAHYSFWSAFSLPREYEWLAPIVIGLSCFAFYQFQKSKRFKSIQACYGGRLSAVIEIGNDRVLFKTKALKASIAWSDISEIHETTRYFVLKTPDNLLIIIPKLALNDQYKQMFVTNLLRRKKIKGSKDAKDF